ncbi:hypothetical protein [Treponema socranskii]|uniref:hypothetical protein n=1 Tax=Treponema socranskii TaxID=53419 RepID=UPI003617FF27
MEIFTRFVHPEKALSPITVLSSEAGRTISTRDVAPLKSWSVIPGKFSVADKSSVTLFTGVPVNACPINDNRMSAGNRLSLKEPVTLTI